MKVAALYIACLNTCNVAATTVRANTKLNLRAARDGGDEAAADKPGFVAPAPGPVASSAASPAGPLVEASLDPARQAEWERHKRRMAESDCALARSKKHLIESKL